MAVGDRISPSTVGDKLIRLTQSDKTPRALAFNQVLVDVDFSQCLPADIVLPLLHRVIDPTGRPIVQHVFRRVRPIELSFRPERSGPHLVWLSEAFHNRWFGALEIEVGGDEGVVLGDEAIGVGALGPSVEPPGGGD